MLKTAKHGANTLEKGSLHYVDSTLEAKLIKDKTAVSRNGNPAKVKELEDLASNEGGLPEAKRPKEK